VRKIIFYLVFIVLALLVSGCATGGGAMVFDNGDRASEHREIQADIRTGETELAVTGTKLEIESRELRSEIGEIGDGIKELEQSISGSQGAEQEIGDILQRVRTRPVDPKLIEGLRNSRPEADSSR